MVLKHITDKLPKKPFKKSVLPLHIYVSTNLADNDFNIAKEIDILIGGLTFWQLIENRREILRYQGVILQDTKLGWIISGQIPFYHKISHTPSLIAQNIAVHPIEKMWILDEFKEYDKHLTEEDVECEKIFTKTTTRDSTGRFIVHIPLEENPSVLGDSKKGATTRFISLERRLSKNVALKTCTHNSY